MRQTDALAIIARLHALAGVLWLLAAVASAPAAMAQDAGKPALWRALAEGEAFAMLRHARAPGFGDPQAFAIGDCATQRNLSEEGRNQARAIGARFRKNGIVAAGVYSSQWCRCLETAELLNLGAVREQPALNSLYERRERTAMQVTALKRFLMQRTDTRPLVLVTHQATISAFTGRSPPSGGIVVARLADDGGVTVLGEL